MLPKRFATAAERIRASELNGGARLVLTGRTRDERQIRVYRGYQQRETVRDSIGHFLIVTAADSEAHPSTGAGRAKDTSTADFEMIRAGSVNVRHPSYDSQYGRGNTRITTSLGQISLPDEITPDNLPRWDSDPIYPEGMDIPEEDSRPPAPIRASA